MEGFCSIVRSRFRKHWRAIACQLHAVSDSQNIKRGFLFDCGAANIESLSDLVATLRTNNLIGEEISIVIVKDDIFILNIQKFYHENKHDVIDISGSLEKPIIIEDLTCITEMFRDIDKQLKSFAKNNSLKLEIKTDWCVPTIFGYLINYPVLYYLRPGEDDNCLSSIDLKVHQVISDNQTLISFSIPTEIYEENLNMQRNIETWLRSFQKSDEHFIKTFTANNPTVIL